MTFTFDTPEEFEAVRLAAHDGILYWKKIRQMCQGKINMNVDGGPTQYTEGYCIDQMISHAKVLDAIEKSPRPVYNEDDYESTDYPMADGDTYESCIVSKVFKLIDSEVYKTWLADSQYVFDDCVQYWNEAAMEWRGTGSGTFYDKSHAIQRMRAMGQMCDHCVRFRVTAAVVTA